MQLIKLEKAKLMKKIKEQLKLILHRLLKIMGNLIIILKMK